MKKIITLIALLLILVGCGSETPTQPKPQGSKTFLTDQEIICVKGKEIWVGWKADMLYEAGGITSQIIGECDYE